MSWQDTINVVSPHVVKIETPTGFGSGFLAFYNHDSTFCGIATAAHVIAHADVWQQPIRISPSAGGGRLLQAQDRVIFIDYTNDSAVAFCLKGDFQLPESPIALLPVGEPCGIGIDVGWLGYPVLEPSTVCFFTGTISASGQSAYLIDGVAINGVSGGPVFRCVHSNHVQIIGCISAYHPNRATGETLPGLARAQDVTHFHGVAAHIRNIDEATAQKREFEKAQQQKLPTNPSPPSAGTAPTPTS